jgi:hypothetical protein
MPKPLSDLTGDRYGSLTVFARATENYRGNAQWMCRCDCGRVKTYLGMDLKKGKLRSCGCKNPSIIANHGMSGTPTHLAWISMRQRCNNPNSTAFADYGGRGIKVCDRWQESFANFVADMGVRPPRHSLERIENNGNYEPGNCRWATQRDQMNNRRCNRFIEIDGKRQTLAQWLRETGMTGERFFDRVKHGWSVEDAIKRPLRKQHNSKH